ncbi:PREDICTED: probable protein phosphatase 2C 33 [Fragaria vesca subsp. vesca]|uniref:probable protein phosphatase 2C 33 n=1 Tax=Fragaria vesca subsp. vesca TaxID=101020 RepID=UPI0002C332AF|nr:PREDICTED: probable protein phosphatase 2C 33 [Fragaria vesca subsp. vesca]
MVGPVVEARRGGHDCMVGLECFLDIVRALGMGSCLSVTGDSAAGYGRVSSSAPSSKRRRRLTGNSSSPAGATSPVSSATSSMEMWLHRVPGRLFLNGFSDVASLFSKQGKKGVNQDAMIAWENFGSKEDTIFCGVFDGHGPSGHMVAKKVRDSLPLKVSSQWVLNTTDANRAGASEENKDSHGEFFATLKDSFLKAFKVMDKELKLHPRIDCYCSGTTAVTMVKQGQDLVIANIGDSRAVLGTRDEEGSLVAVQLTVDLKPNLPREAERITLRKGRVFALHNEPDVSRVWLPNSNSPGLAMARAFGDFCLKDYGLISVPDISYRRLTDKDEFVVLATDGIWDVLSNKEVVEIVAASPRPSAARALVELANRAWKFKYPYAKTDDCAVVCLFLTSGASVNTSLTTPEGKVNSLEVVDVGGDSLIV